MKQELAGYEIDAVNLIANRLGVKVNSVTLVPASRIPISSAERWMRSSLISEQIRSAQQIAFTVPDSANPSILYAPKSANIKSWEDLKNYRISVARGGVQERAANKFAPEGTTLLRFDSSAEETQAIVTGVARENTELLQWLNTTVNCIKHSGKLDAIHRKWFGEPLADLPSF